MEILGFLWLFTSNIQTALSVDLGGISLKPFHLISAVLLYLMLIRSQLTVVKEVLFQSSVLLLLYFFVYSVFAYSIFGFNGLILNYFLSIFCVVLGASIALSVEDVMKTLRAVILLLYLLIFLKLFVFYGEILSFLRTPFGHPNIFYFYGGGANLEAAWCGLFLAFFMKEKVFYLLMAFALIVSLLYASRVGFIVVFGVVVFKALLTYGVLRVAISLLAGFIGLVMMVLYGDFYIIDRFTQIGNDPGSVGRLNLWMDAIGSVYQNPFGYGAGNAVRSLSYGDYIEDNVHNYPLQVLMDFGVAGLIAWLSYYSLILKVSLSNEKYFEFFVFFLVFFMASMIQFRGGEAMFWIIVGIFSGLSSQERGWKWQG